MAETIVDGRFYNDIHLAHEFPFLWTRPFCLGAHRIGRAADPAGTGGGKPTGRGGGKAVCDRGECFGGVYPGGNHGRAAHDGIPAEILSGRGFECAASAGGIRDFGSVFPRGADSGEGTNRQSGGGQTDGGDRDRFPVLVLLWPASGGPAASHAGRRTGLVGADSRTSGDWRPAGRFISGWRHSA